MHNLFINVLAHYIDKRFPISKKHSEEVRHEHVMAKSSFSDSHFGMNCHKSKLRRSGTDSSAKSSRSTSSSSSEHNKHRTSVDERRMNRRQSSHHHDGHSRSDASSQHHHHHHHSKRRSSSSSHARLAAPLQRGRSLELHEGYGTSIARESVIKHACAAELASDPTRVFHDSEVRHQIAIVRRQSGLEEYGNEYYSADEVSEQGIYVY